MAVVFVDQISSASSSASSREIARLEEVVRQMGCRVQVIPDAFTPECSAQDALCWLPNFEEEQAALWLGFIPTPGRYQELFDAALEHNVRLIHTPAQFERAMSLETYAPLLGALTAASQVVSLEDTDFGALSRELAYPVFVKGGVKSNKEQGFEACVARDATQLSKIIEGLARHPMRTQGKVVIRALLPLNYLDALDADTFPRAREYRAFVLHQEVLSVGFYWEGASVPLTREEHATIAQLGAEASRRLDVPYLAVDVGQLEDGTWRIIEVGDAQFMGLSQNPIFAVWDPLIARLDRGVAR